MPARARRRLLAALAGSILAVLVVLSPAIYRTSAALGSAGTLFEIAASDRGRPSASPRDFNCYLISPEFTVRIEESFDFPRATDDSRAYFPAYVPLLHAAIGEYTASGNYYDPALNDRMIRLLLHYLEDSLTIEKRIQGVAPLRYAIFPGNFEATELLLEHGADPQAAVDRPESLIHGLNAEQLATFMQSRTPDYDPRISELLTGENSRN